MITGPNMSGKSAILRQTALITILAQVGSFVPASKLKMGYIDKIFTRVGASDNISQGESTFMVEMLEAASIVNNISERSLILLDEIDKIVFNGIKAEKIEKKIRDNLKLKSRSSYNEFQLSEEVNIIESTLKSLGYYFSKVDAHIESLDNNMMENKCLMKNLTASKWIKP